MTVHDLTLVLVHMTHFKVSFQILKTNWFLKMLMIPMILKLCLHLKI